jgi:signal transduction histidine kinase
MPLAELLSAALICGAASSYVNAAAAEDSGAARLVGVSLDGTAMRLPSGGPIVLPARGAADLFFEFEPFAVGAADQAGTRLLFKLDGVDDDWRDVEGEMRMSIVFVGDKGKQQGSFEFFMRGRSKGWRGTLAASQATVRSGRVVVPPETRRISVALWSGGPASAVGSLIIDGITVHRVDGAGQELVGVFPQDDSMSAWEKFGSDSRWAVVEKIDGHFAMAFVDADRETFAGWRTKGPASLPVEPGQTLEISWREIFSIGGSHRFQARYRGVSPGGRSFRLAAATTEGIPTGIEWSTAIVLPPPLWWRPWFWAACGAGVGAALFAGWRYHAWHRLQLELARVEKAHAVEMERARIAQDLHDELGASLTQIALASDLARDGLGDTVASAEQLDSIFDTARRLARQVDAVVWAVSPSQATVESLAAFLSKEAQQFLLNAGIACRIDMPADLPDGEISSIERRNIHLVLKEALNNVARHAEARHVTLRLVIQDDTITIDIEDDGRGLPADILAGRTAPGQDGLANMRARMGTIGGRLDFLTATAGRGTLVRFTLVPRPLTQPTGPGRVLHGGRP